MARFSQDIEETFVSPSRDSSGNFDFTEVDIQNGRNYVQSNKITPVRVITPAGTSAQQFKLTDGTDTLNVESNGSIQQGVGLVCSANATQANNNTQTIYTAPAGGARVHSLQLSVTGGNIAPVYISVNGVRCLQIIPTTQTSSCNVDLGDNYLSLTSGQTVTVTSTVAGNYGSGSCYVREL